MTLVTEIAILVLAGFVGFAVISKIPNTLHTPLMSGTNAIHGIVVLGGLLLMHVANGWLEHLLLFIAITFGMINIIGGFFVTDRMLEMFKAQAGPSPLARPLRQRRPTEGRSRRPIMMSAVSTIFLQQHNFIDACYIVASRCSSTG